MKPRPYQTEAIRGCFEALKEHRSALVVMPTGCGKTVTFAEIIRLGVAAGRRVLVVAHREELLDQAADKIANLAKCDVAIEQGSRRFAWQCEAIQGNGERCTATANRELGDRRVCGRHTGASSFTDEAQVEPQVIVGCVFSMISRLDRYPPDAFDLVIVDECFPAGTMINGRPIESVDVGDTVRCIDHATGMAVQMPVRRLFKARPRTMLLLRFEHAEPIACTPGHPIYVYGEGYVKAAELMARAGSDVLVVREGIPVEVSARLLLERVQGSEGSDPAASRAATMPKLPVDRDLVGPTAVSSAVREGLLQRRVQSQGSAPDQGEGHGRHESEACERADEGQQPHARPRVQGSDVGNAAQDWTQAVGPGRQWPRTNKGRSGDVERDRLAHELDRADGHAEGEGRVSIALQDRRRQREAEDRHRGRRHKPFGDRSAGAGQEKGGLLGVDRLVGVSVHEPGSDGRFGGLCPDGFVYNLEVEQHHNYFANGVLVHNCHRTLAQTYRDLLDHFAGAKVLGFTATPNRGDEKALAQVYDAVAYDMTLPDAIREGWLVPVRTERIKLESLDLSKVRKQSGDLAKGQLGEVLSAKKTLREAIEPLVERAHDKQAIVFCVTVAHMHCVRAVAEDVARERGLELPMATIDASTPKDERRHFMDAFRARELRWLLNVEVATEGFDAPATEVIAMLRPTLSQALYMQMGGRGTRPLPGLVDGPELADERRAAIAASPKPACLWLDFAGNTERHDMVSPMDLLGGDYGLPDQHEAKRLLERGDAEDLLDALAKAKAAREGRLLEARARAGDPFALFGLERVVDRWGRSMTARQRAYIDALRVPRVLDFRAANTLLAELDRRERLDLCMYSQAALLAAAGYEWQELATMPRKVAGRLVRVLAQRKWDTSEGWLRLRDIAGVCQPGE